MKCPKPDCEFDAPHPQYPCGRWVIEGVTRCRHCGNLDGSGECHCWIPATAAILEADGFKIKRSQ